MRLAIPTHRRRGFLMLALLVGLAGSAAAQEAADHADLLAVLRQGGHVLYFRHAPTDWAQNDRVTGPDNWASCDPAQVRQLSEAGRALARRVGEAMRSLGVPVGQVRSSPYCRAAETARLLALGPVETTRSLMNMRAAEYVGGREATAARAREHIGTPPAAGTNTVLVAHGNLLRAATGEYVGEAGAAVFRPAGDGGFTFVAELTAQDWLRLAGME